MKLCFIDILMYYIIHYICQQVIFDLNNPPSCPAPRRWASYITARSHGFNSDICVQYAQVSIAERWSWIILWSVQFGPLCCRAERWTWCLLTSCDLLLSWPSCHISVASDELRVHKVLPHHRPTPRRSELTLLEVDCKSNVSGLLGAHLFFMAAMHVVTVEPGEYIMVILILKGWICPPGAV